MTILTNIFYFLLFVPILVEMYAINNPRKLHHFVNIKKQDLTESQSNNRLILGIIAIIYLLLNIIGLFTNQWVLFLILLILSMIPKKYILFRFIDALISFCILILILLNHYHLHINLLKLWQYI